MRELNYTSAIREAQAIEMRRDDTVFVVGEDIAEFGSAFGQTAGLLKEFGKMRCVNTPISEAAIMSLAVGAAAAGLRPICIHDFMDFMGCCMDEILNQTAKLKFMMGGQAKIPLVIRAQGGGGINAAAQHSQTLEALFTHIPGLKIIAAANPYDVKGMIAAAVRDDNPVLVIEHKTLLNMKGDVPEESYTIPFGKVDVKREGRDVTIVAWSAMVNKSLEAAEKLAVEGISAEVVDIRSLIPLDKEGIYKSLAKTRKIAIVQEAVKTTGYGAEIAASVAEDCFESLSAPIKRIAAPHTHVPFSPVLEKLYIPSVERITTEIKSMF